MLLITVSLVIRGFRLSLFEDGHMLFLFSDTSSIMTWLLMYSLLLSLKGRSRLILLNTLFSKQLELSAQNSIKRPVSGKKLLRSQALLKIRLKPGANLNKRKRKIFGINFGMNFVIFCKSFIA